MDEHTHDDGTTHTHDDGTTHTHDDGTTHSHGGNEHAVMEEMNMLRINLTQKKKCC